MKGFMGQLLELAERAGDFKIHFASAREAFNMVVAAAEGQQGEPGTYRDYKLRQIMQERTRTKISTERESEVVLR
jgi:hypothetical protein